MRSGAGLPVGLTLNAEVIRMRLKKVVVFYFRNKLEAPLNLYIILEFLFCFWWKLRVWTMNAEIRRNIQFSVQDDTDWTIIINHPTHK